MLASDWLPDWMNARRTVNSDAGPYISAAPGRHLARVRKLAVRRGKWFATNRRAIWHSGAGM